MKENLLAKEQASFALIRMPGSNKSKAFKGKIKTVDSLVVLNDKQGFTFFPFINSPQNPPLFLKPDFISDYTREIQQSLEENLNYFLDQQGTTRIVQTDKASYVENLNKLIGLLKSGEAGKVVISRTTVVEPLSAKHLLLLFDLLCETYPLAFIYLACFPPYGSWMGATPEKLISCDGTHCQTVSLAGTRPLGSQKLWGEKELEEQAIVSRYIKDKLIENKVKNLNVDEPLTLPAGQIEHLFTSFDFDISEPGNLAELVLQLHPTPAVCGFPVEAANQLINRFENHDREYYSGFLGPVNFQGKTELFVNLRCMKITKDRLVLFTGGGITKDSVPEKEWEETELKARTLLAVIEKIRNLAS